MRIITLAAVLAAFLSACATGPGSSSGSTTSYSAADMPTRITPSTPSALCDQQALKLKSPAQLRTAARLLSVSATNQGGAYLQLKSFVEMGVAVSLEIEKILSNIAVPQVYATLLSNQGHKFTVNTGTGAWVYFDTQASAAAGRFLYFGDSAAKTNIYIDWKPATNGYSGKAVYFVPASDVSNAFQEGTFAYDSSAAAPTLDMYLKMKPSNSMNFGDFRVYLAGSNDNSVKASAIVGFQATNYSGQYSFITGWDMVGYAVQSGGGGVTAWTKGVFHGGTNYLNLGVTTNTKFLQIPASNVAEVETATATTYTNDVVASNYTYSEYFSAGGLTTYALATAAATWWEHSYTGLTNTALAITNDTNLTIQLLSTNSGDFYAYTTNTNAIVPVLNVAAGPYQEYYYVSSWKILTASNYVDSNQSLLTGSEPAATKAILGAIPRLSTNAYPANNLPAILP